eukprot:3011678-Pleurochrysis_carterae.AAC.1
MARAVPTEHSEFILTDVIPQDEYREMEKHNSTPACAPAATRAAALTERRPRPRTRAQTD